MTEIGLLQRQPGWRALLIAMLFALGSASLAAEAQQRNVILIIGDGMDDQQITIARNYLVGARGRLTLDGMPFRGVAQVLTVDESGSPVYVADSANSATTMATGQVTSRGRIATSAGTDQPLETIAEMAQRAGYRTGIVTTASVTDATPAAFMAHVNLRFCENPETMFEVKFQRTILGNCRQYMKANGGPGSIARQIAESAVDVVLGGGLKHFEFQAEGRTETLLELAAGNGYHLVTVSSASWRTPPGTPDCWGCSPPAPCRCCCAAKTTAAPSNPEPAGLTVSAETWAAWNCRSP